jgi:integrase
LPITMYDFDKNAFDESKPLKNQYNLDTGIYAVAGLMLLFFTGCRKNEILTLKWEYVDFDKWCFHLPDSKTGSKPVYFGEPALGILNRLKEFEADKAQLSKDTAKTIKSNSYVIKGKNYQNHLVGLQKVWERVRLSIGLKDVRIHDIRHTFASHAVSGGASLPMIGKILGHSEPATTARYAHLFDDPVKALNNKVSGDLNILIGGKND